MGLHLGIIKGGKVARNSMQRESNQGEKLPEIARQEGLEVLDTRGRFLDIHVQLAFGNQDVRVYGSRDPMSWHDSTINQLITLIVLCLFVEQNVGFLCLGLWELLAM